MYCPKCAANNPAKGRFCRKCGTNLGIVSDALSGKLDKGDVTQGETGFFRSSRWELAMVKLLVGVAFIIVAFVLGFDTMTGSVNLWFWFLLPAFVLMGIGIGEIVSLSVKLASEKSQREEFAEEFFTVEDKASLPASKTDYVTPVEDTEHRTEDLVPASVVENTTRRLETDPEGETMTLHEDDEG